MSYDYKNGKKRVEKILDNNIIIEENDRLPKSDNLTFENAYYSWISSIFVDIRNSTSFIQNNDKEVVAKIIRAFTSETIEILRNDDNLREIGIRGDCVYAIYTTPYKNMIYDVAIKSFYVNTLLNMINKVLNEKELPFIKVGVGVASAKELVIKTGRKDVGINEKVWIGNATSRASNLSDIANKNGLRGIAFSDLAYINFIDKLKDTFDNGDATEYFNYHNDDSGIYYDADIIITDFNDWISKGMLD